MKKQKTGASPVLNMPRKTFLTQPIAFQIKKKVSVNYKQKTLSLYKHFDDLQSRIANLKSVENLEKEFKSDSVIFRKWSPSLPVARVWNYFRRQSGLYNKGIPITVTGLLY